MSNYRRLSRAVHLKESRAWPSILSGVPSGPLWMSANYHAFAQEGYVWNPVVHACIRSTVNALAGFDFGVYKLRGNEQVWIEKGSLVDLIERPNPRQSWNQLVGEWAGAMEVAGNAYMEGVSPDRGDTIKRPPRELYMLRSDRMFIKPGTPEIPIELYEYRAGAVFTQYVYQIWRDPQSEKLRPRLPVMHSKYWHPIDDFYGLSPMQAASRPIDAINSGIAWNVSLLQNTARPSGVFTSGMEMSAQQIQEYTNALRQQFSGPANAGRPMVLGNGFTWESLSLTPAEMDWLKTIESNTQMICMIFGVPPEIIGDSASRTYSNYQEARKSVYMEKWLPMTDKLCSDLNTWLTPMFWDEYGDEVFIGYRRDKIEAIQEDRQLVQTNAANLYKATICTMNEARQMVGLDPDPNGDVYFVPTTAFLMPADKLGKTAAAQTQQTINPPKPQIVMPNANNGNAPAEKPKPKKQLTNPELEMLYGQTMDRIKRLQ